MARYDHLPIWAAVSPVGAALVPFRVLAASFSAANKPSQPFGIPMRIIAGTFHQPSTQGIGDDVARDFPQVFFPAQGMVVKPGLPQWQAAGIARAVDPAAADGFKAPHGGGQVSGAQLEQPMQVIRHEDKAQGVRIPRHVAIAQSRNRQTCQGEIGKNRHTTGGGSGDQVNAAAFGKTPATQIGAMWHERQHKTDFPQPEGTARPAGRTIMAANGLPALWLPMKKLAAKAAPTGGDGLAVLPSPFTPVSSPRSSS